jgi:hypothetical protein
LDDIRLESRPFLYSILLRGYKLLARGYLSMTEEQLKVVLKAGKFVEI